MQVHFAGVGEACEESLPHTSLLVYTRKPRRCILLDCGFTSPPGVFRSIDSPEEIDAVWISHFHGDHVFGLPLLLHRMREAQRNRPLLLAGQSGTLERVQRLADLAYPGLPEKIWRNRNKLAPFSCPAYLGKDTDIWLIWSRLLRIWRAKALH